MVYQSFRLIVKGRPCKLFHTLRRLADIFQYSPLIAFDQLIEQSQHALDHARMWGDFARRAEGFDGLQMIAASQVTVFPKGRTNPFPHPLKLKQMSFPPYDDFRVSYHTCLATRNFERLWQDELRGFSACVCLQFARSSLTS